jgi:hypothetical protein
MEQLACKESYKSEYFSSEFLAYLYFGRFGHRRKRLSFAASGL